MASCAVLLAGCAAPTRAGTAPTAASPVQPCMQALWREWATAEPVDTNPVADRTGEHGAHNQPSDDVWFLAGTFGGQAQRRCAVPLGMRIVAPAINRVSGNADDCRT
jgi:hypothetical protein